MDEAEKKIKQAIQEIPSESVNNLRVALLQEWKEKEETVVIFPKPAIKKYPGVYFFGLLAKDWHGLVVSATGIITGKWNIATHWGMILPYKKEKLGMMIFGIEVESKGNVDEILACREEIREKLYKACFKGWRKHILLVHGTKKVEMFEEVMELLKQHRKLEYELAEEVTKFFDSRGEEYLEERSPKDLAELILTNYKFIQKVRKSGGKPQVKVKHLRTKKEKLTGITIVCWDRDFSLLLAIDAIREISFCTLKYNKEFVTPDGISVYRIEINEYQSEEEIEKSIMRKITTRKFERVALKQSVCGFEQYSRAIIPKLIKEHSSTLIPQVYISPEFIAPEFIHFKVIIVKDISFSWTTKAIGKLDKIKGFTVLGSKPPTVYQNSELSIFDLRVNTKVLLDTDSIYSTIRETLGKTLGKFRDFDEGMRRMDIEKFSEVKRQVKWVSRDLLREIYYGIEDFCRVNSSQEEIVEIVKLGVHLSRAKAPNIKWIEVASCTLIGVSSRKNILSQVLKILVKYETGVSKIQIGDLNLLLLRIEKEGKELSQNETEPIIQKITQIL